jgi:prenyltransferase beta subunit
MFRQRASEILLVHDAMVKLSEWLLRVQKETEAFLSSEQQSSLSQLGDACKGLTGQLEKLKPVAYSFASGQRSELVNYF